MTTERSICPRCRNEFNCSPSGKCWCFEVEVPVEVQEKVSRKYDGCLCPACLREVSAGKE